MNILIALNILAVLSMVRATHVPLCQKSADRRHMLVTCVNDNVNEQTSQKLTEVKQGLNCEDLDCVFTRICDMSPDGLQQHADSFLPDEVKTDLRAAVTRCETTT
nr:uncharacterized protein LOC119169437 [Rhipicephalus microplus]